MTKERKIAIVGLGYVGLPLAAEFAKSTNVLAFDIDSNRVEELNSFYDQTNEVPSRLLQNKKIKFTDTVSDIASSDFYIICVPTPVNKNLKPNLEPLKSASRLVGSCLLYTSDAADE